MALAMAGMSSARMNRTIKKSLERLRERESTRSTIAGVIEASSVGSKTEMTTNTKDIDKSISMHLDESSTTTEVESDVMDISNDMDNKKSMKNGIKSSSIPSEKIRSTTLKSRKTLDAEEKTRMWSLFDSDEVESSSISPLKTSVEPLCIYDKIADRSTCDACSFAVRMTPEGFYACANPLCGRLYKDRLEHSAEWRFYGENGGSSVDPTRCGMPTNPLLEEASFGCTISSRGSSSYEMCKIRRYTEWQSMPYREKAQYLEFERIKSIASVAGIPKLIIDEAMKVHKRISEQKTFRGLNRDGIIAASIYIACRIHNYPRTAKEIASIFHLDSTSATKGCKNATTILNQIETESPEEDKTVLHTTSPMDFIQRFCSRLSFNEELTKVAQFVCIQVERRKIIPENTPHSVAAGIIYYIVVRCGLNISKTDIRAISDISEVTIGKCFKKLDSYPESLIPSAILKKYNKPSHTNHIIHTNHSNIPVIPVPAAAATPSTSSFSAV